MKIEQEDFNKLKQLDRIEFRQIYNEIRLSHPISELIIICFLLFIISKLISYGSILILMYWILLFISLKELYKFKKELKKLEEKYFKIEVNKNGCS